MMSVYDDKLMRAFRFTPEDLAANREGRLSERQKQQLWRRYVLNAISSLGVIITLIVVGILAAAVRIFMVTLCMWALAGVIGVLVVRQRRGTANVLMLAGIEGVEGRAMLGRREQATGDRHVKASTGYLEIDLMRFDLTEPQYKAFAGGAHYTIYYVGNTILSAYRHDPMFPV